MNSMDTREVAGLSSILADSIVKLGVDLVRLTLQLFGAIFSELCDGRLSRVPDAPRSLTIASDGDDEKRRDCKGWCASSYGRIGRRSSPNVDLGGAYDSSGIRSSVILRRLARPASKRSMKRRRL